MVQIHPSPSNNGKPNYALDPGQVPDFPGAGTWVDRLRWCVAVMDADDRDIGFAASLLSHAHKLGELSEKQSKFGLRVVERVRDLWAAGKLSCQQANDSRSTRVTSLPREAV